MEFVWVVRRRDLFPSFTPHGFVPLGVEELEDRYLSVVRERGFFVERREAEVTPAWKQVIPYCTVRWEDQVLVLKRLRAQSEARLHGLLSIGVGGHINPQDAEAGDLIARAAEREVSEELKVDPPFRMKPIGILNDDGSEVGAVHVGVVFGLRMDRAPEVRERDKMTAIPTSLADLAALCENPSSIESWSREILAVSGWENGF
ncbi:MAG: hypothetical protein CMJ85_02290 [Planctomycetes bacterium]|nr:hypothetical protein [Planctomycetota bacterium]